MPEICIHAHLYQPSRENPWTGQWEHQPSAAPFSDWNTRIAAECYGPMGTARLLDHRGRLRDTVNLYKYLSFDMGPTLMGWLEHNEPELHETIVQADREAVSRTGHGTAMAQSFHHTILPLCRPWEKDLEITWGLADFRRRFGREAEGFWLPECAVDLDTLDRLAGHGIRWVVLAPQQLLQVKAEGDEAWQDAGDVEDLSARAYEVALPSGATIAVFPYHGPAAHGIAFDGWLHDGEALAERLRKMGEGRPLLHLATDGESYGHHHARGEMAIAAAMQQIVHSEDASLTTYGAFLDKNPPTWQARIIERSSWSCAHGVGRWTTDCGCHTGGAPEGWHQRWRGALRASFESLRDRVRKALAPFGPRLFLEPAACLQDYADVAWRQAVFEAWYTPRSATEDPADPQIDRAHAWLEIHRHLLAMSTSCAWFFDDAGIEARQNVRHAARALGLLKQFFRIDMTDGFRLQLDAIPVNEEPGRLSRTLDAHLAPPEGTPWLSTVHPLPKRRLPGGERCGGVLCHITSLPGQGPIGDLDDAPAFVDWLASSGLRIWQVLPLCPTGMGDSPYSSWSSLSGNPLLIGLKPLERAGLLPQGTADAMPSTLLTDYAAAHRQKEGALLEAARRLLAQPNHPWREAHRSFVARNPWALEAGLFLALQKAHDNQPWWTWPGPLREHDEAAVREAALVHHTAIEIWTILQFFFEQQWQDLRHLCAARGVQLLGDIPIYVGEHSVDVWAHQHLFQLTDGRPSEVAGCPPDAFSEDGQRWGNPLYDWSAMAEDDWRWWSARIQRSLHQTDFVRIDHFIGLVRYWSIPADAPTAATGAWREGPGQAFFDGIERRLGSLPLVVEDLGLVDEATRSLQESLGLPGMRIVPFGYLDDDDNEHKPANHPRMSIAYTGTHDTDTVRGWWLKLTEAERALVRADFHEPSGDAVQQVLRDTLHSPAAWAIVPLQDFLALGTEARMNLPGTARGNWRWRASSRSLTMALSVRIRTALFEAGRSIPQPHPATLATPESHMDPHEPSVAYFCMEYGLDASFPIYSGGLGVLAGDIIKAAHDQERPMVAIGLFWRHGYSIQRIGPDGEQLDEPTVTRRDVLQPTGVQVEVTIRGKTIPITAHKVTAFGNIPLYLLEPVNEEDRWLTDRLYIGTGDDRVAQELLLGVGGIRMLRALGLHTDVLHFNEGHALFAGFELLREQVALGASFEQARQQVRQRIIFTTHTPVPAGNEIHSLDRLFEQGADLGAFTRDELQALGGAPFEMTPAALRLCRMANGVAELHGETARKMWAHVPDAAPILSITNGVHMPTWQDDDVKLAHLQQDEQTLWNRHNVLKAELFDEIEERTGVRLRQDVLTIGFARRAATYKRATLVLRDLQWLRPLIEADRFQVVFAGKAHPQDGAGKAVVRELVLLARQFPNNVVFLENYDMDLGALLTRGCDVWLNNPRRPHEASGTSGMKAAANGCLNLSILDGWWDEGCDHGINGWQIGDRYQGPEADARDLHSLQTTLVQQVLPVWEADKPRWIGMMHASIETAMTRFSASRMVSRYYAELYDPVATHASVGDEDAIEGELVAG